MNSGSRTRLWMRTADGGTSTRIELAPFSTRYRSLAVSIWLSQANERRAAFGIARCQTERLKLGRAADHVHIPMLIPRLRPRPTISARLCPMLRSDMAGRSEEHTSELQSLMRISYAVFCLKK